MGRWNLLELLSLKNTVQNSALSNQCRRLLSPGIIANDSFSNSDETDKFRKSVVTNESRTLIRKWPVQFVEGLRAQSGTLWSSPSQHPDSNPERTTLTLAISLQPPHIDVSRQNSSIIPPSCDRTHSSNGQGFEQVAAFK